MAFEGRLEDLAIVDILQLLHVSRKTGVLLVFSDDSEGNIVLKDGRIVGCRHPSGDNIGKVLVGMDAVTDADIESALRVQQDAGTDRLPLMATLIEMGTLDRKTGWQALERLIESTMVELVAWQQGSFVFEVGEIDSHDDFAHTPDDVDAHLSVNTEAALMEAVRILDERNRKKGRSGDDDSAPSFAAGDQLAGAEEPHASAAGDGQSLAVSPDEAANGHSGPVDGWSAPESDLADGAGAPLTEDADDGDELGGLISERLGESWKEVTARRVILFSDDGLLKMSMRTTCAENDIDLCVSEIAKDIFEKIATWHGEVVPPVVICDLNSAAGGDNWRRECLRTLARCREDHADVPLIILAEPRLECFSEAFALGAAAVLPRPNVELARPEYVDEMRKLYLALVSCMHSTFARRSVLANRLREARRRMSVLKDRVREVRFPDGPSQISLVVLRHVAEYVERCVLFLVRKNDLLALGAFGLDDTAETVGTAITRLRMPITNGSVVAKAVHSGRFYCGDNTDALLKSHLYECIGEPADPEMVLVPLRTKDKTAAIIYGDFGNQKTDLVETDSLEILADHAGMAFELALAERD